MFVFERKKYLCTFIAGSGVGEGESLELQEDQEEVTSILQVSRLPSYHESNVMELVSC